MKRALCTMVAIALLLAGCDDAKEAQPKTTPTATATAAAATASASVAATQPAAEQGNPLADPKASIAHQYELLTAGRVEDLAACFTERLRSRITEAIVNQGKEQIGKMTLDDLVADVQMADDKKSAKIKMKNGRTLTTLVETDGKWLADTIWFK